MLPKYHLILGGIFSLLIHLLFPITSLQATTIFLSSFLIDLDHYFIFIYRKKQISPKKFWDYSLRRIKKFNTIPKNQRKNYKSPIFIFHGLEFIIPLILLTYFSSFFLWILIGVLFHLFLDHIHIIHKKLPNNKISQIYNLESNKNKKEL